MASSLRLTSGDKLSCSPLSSNDLDDSRDGSVEDLKNKNFSSSDGNFTLLSPRSGELDDSREGGIDELDISNARWVEDPKNISVMKLPKQAKKLLGIGVSEKSVPSILTRKQIEKRNAGFYNTSRNQTELPTKAQPALATQTTPLQTTTMKHASSKPKNRADETKSNRVCCSIFSCFNLTKEAAPNVDESSPLNKYSYSFNKDDMTYAAFGSRTSCGSYNTI